MISSPPIPEPCGLTDDLRDALIGSAFPDGPQKGDVIVIVCLRAEQIDEVNVTVEHVCAVRSVGASSLLSPEIIADALRIEADILAAGGATVDEGEFS